MLLSVGHVLKFATIINEPYLHIIGIRTHGYAMRKKMGWRDTCLWMHIDKSLIRNPTTTTSWRLGGGRAWVGTTEKTLIMASELKTHGQRTVDVSSEQRLALKRCLKLILLCNQNTLSSHFSSGGGWGDQGDSTSSTRLLSSTIFLS